jgi:tetratricopeptide (TPR) repeat protein
LQSAIYIKLAQFEKCLETLLRLEQIPQRHLQAMDLAEASNQTGQALEKLGRFSEAELHYERAETTFLREDKVIPASMARLGRARCLRAQGQPNDAITLAQSAGSALGSAGSKVGVADALFQLGEVARIVDDLDRAEHHYRKAQRGYRRIGSNKRLDAEMMLAMVLIEREAFLEARLLLEQLMTNTRERENRQMNITLHLLLANCCGQDDSWTEWMEHVSEAKRILDEAPIIDFDIATYAERAALGAYQANQLNAARIPQDIADAQFKALKTRGE